MIRASPSYYQVLVHDTVYSELELKQHRQAILVFQYDFNSFESFLLSIDVFLPLFT